MNRSEALDVLRDQMAAFTAMPYQVLLPFVGRRDHLLADGASGVRYQVEIQIVWDDPSKTMIRVIGSIDDGGIRAFVPLTVSFLVSIEDPTTSS